MRTGISLFAVLSIFAAGTAMAAGVDPATREEAVNRGVDPATREEAVNRGVGSARQALEAMEGAELPGVLQSALNSMVEEGVSALRDAGFGTDAERLGTEWRVRYAEELISLSATGLGDHRAMSEWLTGFHADLVIHLGADLTHQLRLDDIRVFNFGLPVTLHPSGCHGDSWDRAEYAAHFVPVAGAGSYWVTRSVCNAVLPGLLSLLCGQAGEVVRSAVEAHIAPELSDYVYGRAHGENVSRPVYDLE